MFALEIAKKLGTKRYETWKQAAEAAKKAAARKKAPVLVRRISNSVQGAVS